MMTTTPVRDYPLDFEKDLMWVHFCNGKILRPMPKELCFKCKNEDSFDRSMPPRMVEKLIEEQKFLLSIGFDIEQKYGRDSNEQGN